MKAIDKIYDDFDKERRKAWIDGSSAAHNSFMDMVEKQMESKDDN